MAVVVVLVVVEEEEEEEVVEEDAMDDDKSKWPRHLAAQHGSPAARLYYIPSWPNVVVETFFFFFRFFPVFSKKKKKEILYKINTHRITVSYIHRAYLRTPALMRITNNHILICIRFWKYFYNNTYVTNMWKTVKKNNPISYAIINDSRSGMKIKYIIITI